MSPHLAQRNLQVFNLELKTKIKSHMMSEDVVFWKWLDLKTIGLVTERNVYRWSIEGESAPQKIFERHASLSDSQIINLRASADEKWYVLVGIASREGRVGGYMQLYSKERGVSQPIEGHAAAFAEITLEDAAHPTKLFTFAVRSPSNLSAKVISQVNVLHHPTQLIYYKYNYSSKSSKWIMSTETLHSKRRPSRSFSLLTWPAISLSPCKSATSTVSSSWSPSKASSTCTISRLVFVFT